MSSYKEGQTHQLMERFEAEGFTAEDLTELGQAQNLHDFRGVLRGTHNIVEKEKSFRRVNNPDGTISFFVRANRSLTPQQVLDETGRQQHVTSEAVASMPKGEGDEVEVVFFNPGRQISDDNLKREYEKRGLVPADPYSVAAVNRDDPAFADKHPNSTHWKDPGKWCFLACRRWHDGRGVRVFRFASVWGGGWWFAGLRKSSQD